MNLKLTLLSSAILLIGALLIWSGPKSKTSKPDLSCAIIHAPAQGCPPGYLKEKRPRFVQKDGSREFACVDQTGKKRHCIDVLKPGEGIEFIIELEPPPAGGPTT